MGKFFFLVSLATISGQALSAQDHAGGAGRRFSGPGEARAEAAVTLLSRVITRSVQEGGCFAPDPVTTAFLSTESRVWIWFEVDGVAAGDRIRAEWLDPSGAFYTGFDFTPPNAPGYWCFWSWMAIAGFPPASQLGTWQIRLLYNGAPLFVAPFSIIQSGSCSWSLSSASQSVPAAGGSGSVSVFAGPACAWSSFSRVNWITITSGSGLGNGAVSFQVAANTGDARSGTLEIAGRPFTVDQAAAGTVVDVTKCVSPRALNLFAIRGESPSRHVLRIGDETAPRGADCAIERQSPFNVSVTFLNGANWLTVSPTSLTLQPGQPNTVTATVNYSALPSSGVYQALLIGRGPCEDPPGSECVATIPASVTLSEPRARIVLSSSTFVFGAAQGSPAPPPQTLRLINAVSGSLNWSLPQNPATWLTVSPQSGTASAVQGSAISLTANPAGLSPGTYQVLVPVSSTGASNDPQLLTVTLNVVAPTAAASPALSPNGLLFAGVQSGIAPPTQSFTLSNSGGGTATAQFSATTTSGGNWLTVSPSSATTASGPMNIQVTPSLAGLSTGVYSGKITATLSPGGSQEVDVILVVASAAATGATGLWPVGPAGGLSLPETPGGVSTRQEQCAPTGSVLVATTLGNGLSVPVSFPRPLLALMVDTCGAALNGATVVATIEGAGIALQPVGAGLYSGSWVPQRVATSVPVTFVGLHPSFTTPARRSFTVSTAAAPGGVQLPQLFDDGVVEGAGFTPRRPLVPGGIVSLFGTRLGTAEAGATRVPLERELAGISVRIGRTSAPLYYVSPGQINAQVPFEALPGESVGVVVISAGRLTSPQNYLVAPAQPGIFKAGANAAVLDSQSRIVTAQNPARIGDTLQIFATGLGATDPGVETGAGGPSSSNVRLPVTVTIGGIPATVVYQGLAPNFVGLYQVNVVVPSDVTLGDAVPLVITQNGIPSNPNLPITIPVRAP